MEQRRYRSTITPEALGDYLVQHFNSERRTEAQRLGNGESVLVQVRQGHDDHWRIALTLGITHGAAGAPMATAPGISHPADTEPEPPMTSAGAGELVVTLGEQQWFNQSQLSGGIVGSLIGALFTPWALFGLIWPATQALRDRFMPNDIWGLIDNYLLTQGGQLLDTTDIVHPHQ